MRVRVQKLVVLAVLLSAGCADDGARSVVDSDADPTRVLELDTYVVNLEGIARTSKQQSVAVLLGEPPFVREHRVDGELLETTWLYPIRDITRVPLPAGGRAQRRVIPAAVLRIRLDGSARVAQWGFVHPVTGSPLAIRESLEQADAWLEHVCNAPKRIELAVLLQRGASKSDVLEGMRWLEGLSTDLEKSQVRITREGDEETLTYYADRPSPLYVPPSYVIVTFWVREDLGTGWHFASSWGSCK
jgi:hypothetical protein